MVNANLMMVKTPIAAAPAVVFDPAQPLHRPAGGLVRAEAFGQNRRSRRSTILASIRSLLADEGHDAITVRRIAENSGHAVQTIYNLLGPRDLAITEAVTEYSQYVCLTAIPNPADPLAALAMIDREVKSIEAHPEFCRNVCKMYFSDSRAIFYDFRNRQTKMLHNFLLQQQKSGIIHAKADTRYMAENFMLFMGAIFVEWTDFSSPIEQLRQRLHSVYLNVMAEAIVTPARRVDGGA